MASSYRFAKDPQDPDVRPSWSKVFNLQDGIAEAVSRLKTHQGQGFMQKLVGDNEFGPVRTLEELKERLRGQLKDDKVGAYRLVLALSDDYRLLIRKVETEPRLIDTTGNDKIDKIHSALVDKFDGWESWGICNIRYISGSSVWSQHSWCNAEDVHATSAKLDAINKFLIEQRERGLLPVGKVLWRVADHYGHLHYEASPAMTGTPPGA